MQTLTFSVSLCNIPSKKEIHKILVNCLKKNMKLFILMPTLFLNQEWNFILFFLCIDSVANTLVTYCHLLRMIDTLINGCVTAARWQP